MSKLIPYLLGGAEFIILDSTAVDLDPYLSENQLVTILLAVKHPRFIVQFLVDFSNEIKYTPLYVRWLDEPPEDEEAQIHLMHKASVAHLDRVIKTHPNTSPTGALGAAAQKRGGFPGGTIHLN